VSSPEHYIIHQPSSASSPSDEAQSSTSSPGDEAQSSTSHYWHIKFIRCYTHASFQQHGRLADRY
jgi:hypothetical protein